MFKPIPYFSLMLLFLVSVSCSTAQVERRLDKKLSDDSVISTREDLRRDTIEAIDSSETLNSEQKTSLKLLQASIREELAVLNDETLKLRTELIRDLIAPKFDKWEVNLIKTRLEDLEAKKVSVLFKGVDKANVIMGRDVVKNKEVLERFFSPHQAP